MRWRDWWAMSEPTDSEVRLTAERARWQRLDAVLTRVEADLRSSLPRPARRGAGKDAAWSLAPTDSAGNALLVFTRAGPSAIDEPGNAGQRVGYRFRNGHIEALYWPHIDNVAADDATSYALTDDVVSFHATDKGSAGPGMEVAKNYTDALEPLQGLAGILVATILKTAAPHLEVVNRVRAQARKAPGASRRTARRSPLYARSSAARGYGNRQAGGLDSKSRFLCTHSNRPARDRAAKR